VVDVSQPAGWRAAWPTGRSARASDYFKSGDHGRVHPDRPHHAGTPGEPNGRSRPGSDSAKNPALSAMNPRRSSGTPRRGAIAPTGRAGLAGGASNALVGLDAEFPRAHVDAIDWTFFDAGPVHDVDAGRRDDARHFSALCLRGVGTARAARRTCSRNRGK
jgi:hypothetical protein